LEVVSSFIVRVVVKLVTDFTSIVHFKHPIEMGGLQWTFSLTLTLASLPIAVYAYGVRVGEDRVYEGAKAAGET
jgi:hypothetical protein